MRTYTVRSFRPAGHPGNAGSAPEIGLDFVLHGYRDQGGLVGGPASVWAAEARTGDEVIILGPNRALCGHDYGGSGDLLDPGIAPPGDAFIEVPSVEDIQGSFARSGVAVQWLPCGMQDPGTLLAAAVRSMVALPGAGAVDPGNVLEDVDVDEGILWETTAGTGQPFHAWLPGEAGRGHQIDAPLPRPRGRNRPRASVLHGVLARRPGRSLGG